MEKEQDLQKTIDVLKKDNVEMGREIISLKRQIGGYKAANERYRKDLEKCKKEAQDEVTRLHVELAKALKASNEKIDELSKKLADKDNALTKSNEKVDLVSQNNKDLADEICACKAQIDWYNSLPWYEKFFVMTIEAQTLYY